MTDQPNSKPVSLPAGSYDFQKLQKGLDHAAELKTPAARDAAVGKALTEASNRDKARETDMGARADQTRVKVEREELGVTENVLVHNPKSAAAKDAAEEAEQLEERLEQGQATSGTTGGAENTTGTSRAPAGKGAE
jgi:hypothetical protein